MNKYALEIIRDFEGLRLRAYPDLTGILTIAWGHTGPDVYEGQVITQDEAEDLLDADVLKVEQNIKLVVKVPLNEYQSAALISFTFNLGIGNLKKSTLLKKLNNKDYNGAADEFLRWNKAGGKVYEGLTRRRTAERKLFLKQD